MNVEAWWFSNADGRLGYDDGRTATIGGTHDVEGEIIPCKNGLHGSKLAINALNYASGPVVWKVKLHGTVVSDYDKHVASHRTYLAGGINVDNALRRLAWLCAVEVHHLWSDDELPDHLKEWDGKKVDGLGKVYSRARNVMYQAGLVKRHDSKTYAADAMVNAVENSSGVCAARMALSLAFAAKVLAGQERGEGDGSCGELRRRQKDRLTAMLEEAIKLEGA